MKTLKEVTTINAHTDAIFCLTFNPKGTMLASGS